MAEEKQQDGQKTLVAFIVGLLIGGLLVWAFSDPTPSDSPDTNRADDVTAAEVDDVDTSDTTGTPSVTTSSDDTTPEAPELPQLQVGDGSIRVSDQPASATIALDSATYPVSEGWIGVRDLTADGNVSYILGVVRFSESQGLVPESIILQRPTTPGVEYAVVVFAEDGDFDFAPRYDIQIDQIFDTFTAQ